MKKKKKKTTRVNLIMKVSAIISPFSVNFVRDPRMQLYRRQKFSELIL